MRILLDTTYARRGHSGTATYLARLGDALRELDVAVVETANEARRPPAGGGWGSVRNLAHDRWWTDIELPRRAYAWDVDVIHHPLPALSRLTPCPQVVTVHDLAFERLPGHFPATFRQVSRREHRRAVHGADAVICVSETTALDVRALWGVSGDRVVVARHGPGSEPDAHRSPRREPEHLLYVGDAEPRKNLSFLLGAYALYREHRGATPLPLVLAGPSEAWLENQDGVEIVADPDDARLAELYAGAVALVHPALYEGFGLTLLEAMSAGVPVLAARAPGVVEVCGEGAAGFDPRDARALATMLEWIVGDRDAQRDLGERGRRRAAEFSWARSARLHIEAYTLALEGTPAAMSS